MKEPYTSAEAPRPAGAYSQALRAGDFVFVSGQVPRSPDGSYTRGTIAEETRLTIANLGAIAAATGGGLGDIVKVTAYLADPADLAGFNSQYAQHFPAPPPARTTVVAGLREVRVELDAVLYLPR